jgi:hypothetical protein
MIKLKSLLPELTQKQKELKRDYLFRRTRLKSSNTIPSWNNIWNDLKNSDGYKNEYDAWAELPDEYTDEEIEQKIYNEQEIRYEDIVGEYESLNGDLCWRRMTLHSSVNPITLPKLGIFWATAESAAATHWGKFSPEYPFLVTYEGVIDLSIVDWPGTLYARMSLETGDIEKEIRFLNNSRILIKRVKISVRTPINKPQDEIYEINDWRRV